MVSVCRPVCFASSCLGQSNRPIKRNLDVMSRVVKRRGFANVGQFICTPISNGPMEQNYTAHVECLGYTCMWH